MAWKSELYCTAFTKAQLPPPSVTEIAFLGRSNVGKSTLINALLGRKVARVSAHPGKTASINFYNVTGNRHKFALVDLPGYGYAERGRETRDQWRHLIEDYFKQKRKFLFAVHLIDFRHGVLANDAELIQWFDAMEIPRLVIFTKGDKIARGKRKQQYDAIMRTGPDGRLVSVLPPFVTEGVNNGETEHVRNGIEDIITELEENV